ncbi:hypothetical protein ACR22U_000523 [Escherichia coli]|uniref:hypothetical protein n=1 Tax=Escherichia coli TaxID=562 RepID=UPI00071BFE90|nr:hypothetical protein [Escherichia coli]EFN8413106.1 hypothetical protein [Escherichia coli O7]ALQ58817.1 hypothetical protein AB850_09935 [Escherichia coli]AWY92263.1 hypothetical protein DIZ83_23590 [Escherichia coli]EEV8827057.1 hypothetical protein [Escherichia coli]EEY5799917.1 hypothetical protein [Escherichia coli]
MNKTMLVMLGLLFSPLAVAGQITMTDPEQETTESGKTLCTYQNSIYLFTYVTKGKCPYAKTFDTDDSQ